MARVLVIDDNRSVAETTCRLATYMGHIAESVTSIHRFEATFLRFRPDAFVLDIVMPGRDGLQILHWLEEASYGGRVILMSGDGALCQSCAEAAAGRGRVKVTPLQKPSQYVDLERALQDHGKAPAT